MADRSIGQRSISVLGRVRGDVILDVLFLLRLILAMIVNPRLALTGPDVLVFPATVHHGVKSILVRPITDHPDATVRFLHAVLAGHAAPCKQKTQNGQKRWDRSFNFYLLLYRKDRVVNVSAFLLILINFGNFSDPDGLSRRSWVNKASRVKRHRATAYSKLLFSLSKPVESNLYNDDQFIIARIKFH